MEHDQNGTDDPEEHVQAKPVFEHSPALHGPRVLAQRVAQQRHQHDQTADQAKVETEGRTRGEIVPVGDYPADPHEQHDARNKAASSETGPLPPRVHLRSLCGL